MKNNILLIISTVLLIITLIVCHTQYKQLKDYKELLEMVDTTKTNDTLYIEKQVIDTVPKLVQTTIVRRDTLWKDSTMYQIAYKKKLTKIL